MMKEGAGAESCQPLPFYNKIGEMLANNANML